MALLTPLAQAGVTINIDPTGGGGANPNNVLAATGFSWAPGNTVAIGGGSLTPASVGTNITLLYDAIIAGIPTTGANSASIGSNNGNILINGVNNTSQQFVITAQFTETVQTVNTTTGVITFTPNLALGANTVKIWAGASNQANSATNNDPNATGFPTGSGPPPLVPTNSTLILSGSVTAAQFTSSFQANTATDPRVGGTPVPLNQFGGTSYPTTTTLAGTGNTGLIVAVSSVNPAYFLTPPTVLALNFSQGISTGVPFNGVVPQTTLPSSFGTGQYNPNVGSTNGTGADFLFQSQAANNFTIPEPSSIVMACTAAGVVSLAGLWRRRKATRTARS
jgi:hypothetical protein